VRDTCSITTLKEISLCQTAIARSAFAVNYINIWQVETWLVGTWWSVMEVGILSTLWVWHSGVCHSGPRFTHFGIPSLPPTLNSGEPVPEETFTHWHLLWSSIVPYLLHSSKAIHETMTSSLFNPRTWQSFPQSVSKFSLVYLLAWHPPLYTPYISSLNHCLLFATHAHTIAAYFAVVLRLCHLILVSLSTFYLEFYLVVSCHTSM